MATIQKRNDKYRVLIRKAGQPVVSKTFSKLVLAKKFANQVEADMEKNEFRAEKATLGFVIEDAQATLPLTYQKAKMYRRLHKLVGDIPLQDLTAQFLIDFALQRSKEVKPSSIAVDFSYIRVMLKYAENRMNLRPSIEEYNRAKEWLKSERILQTAEARDRRVSDQELAEIASKQCGNHTFDLAELMRFAVLTAMRKGEQFDLRWAELSEAERTVGVWRKHPKRGKVYSRVPLLEEAFEIIKKQPNRGGRIFAISAYRATEVFRNCRDQAGIENLRWHDLRHEGCSRLHELGLDSMTVQLFSGHRDLAMLNRYTHLKATNVVERLRKMDL
jgi:integrase